MDAQLIITPTYTFTDEEMQTHACVNASGRHRLTSTHTHLFLATGSPVRQQQLHGADHLLPDGVQQGVARVDAVVEKELHDLQVLVLDGDEERAAAQRVQAVNVHVVVDLRLA